MRVVETLAAFIIRCINIPVVAVALHRQRTTDRLIAEVSARTMCADHGCRWCDTFMEDCHG